MSNFLVCIAVLSLAIPIDWILCTRIAVYYLPKIYRYNVNIFRLIALILTMGCAYWSANIPSDDDKTFIITALPAFIGLAVYTFLVVRHVKTNLNEEIVHDRYGD